MIIGVPKEIKTHEYRVGMTPAGVAELKADGHTVLVEESAGIGSGFSNEEYIAAGAELTDPDSLFERSELVIKVKEPVAAEYSRLRDGSALFTYLHLAPNPSLIKLLLDKKMAAFAYETLEHEGHLPLLKPMSCIAGRMAPLMASYFLQKIHGGSGILSTGSEGVSPARALILGSGVVGTNAAMVCSGMGMITTVADCNPGSLERLAQMKLAGVTTLPLDICGIDPSMLDADIIICAILVTGMKTPVLIPRASLSSMRRGAVLVDVSIDQGGCAETSRPTTHDNPVYIVDDIVHYMVANMPGAYPRTSTLALTNATLPYIKMIANEGICSAINSPALRSSLNTYSGKIIHPGLARSIG